MIRLVLRAGLSLLLVGCASQNTPPALPSPVSATATLPPATPTLTATPVETSIQILAERANCRFGPGTVYETLNELQQGRSLTAVGRNENSTWWQVEDPLNPGGFCWVAAEVTESNENMPALPVLAAPLVSITKAELRVEPSRIVVGCNQFPQTVFFEAKLTANGPTLLTWQWEASTGATSGIGTLVFEQAGTQVLNDYYQVNSPNEYWVKLHIFTPNEQVEQVSFPVSCTP